jgi:hypothetical protein
MEECLASSIEMLIKLPSTDQITPRLKIKSKFELNDTSITYDTTITKCPQGYVLGRVQRVIRAAGEISMEDKLTPMDSISFEKIKLYAVGTTCSIELLNQ